MNTPNGIDRDDAVPGQPLQLGLKIQPQPTDTSCGPTCLQAVYNYFGDAITVERMVDEIRELEDGGTLAVHLGAHALKRGYRASVMTFNLRIFDPTWFDLPTAELREKLIHQTKHRKEMKRRLAAKAYLEFLDSGGVIQFRELTAEWVRKTLRKRSPILAGLSATFLYRTAREIPSTNVDDDLNGEPLGHFVVLCGYNFQTKQVLVADPYQENPISGDRFYWVGMNRLINAILLGVLTYDGNLLVLQKP